MCTRARAAACRAIRTSPATASSASACWPGSRPRWRERGDWCYRRLFWECGLIGQVLYLEAEAAGAGGTGIGCFYDDPVHDTLGLTGHAWQSLYHFTRGRARRGHAARNRAGLRLGVSFRYMAVGLQAHRRRAV